MGSESYWLDTAPAFTGAQPGALPGQVDVAIVGGGFTGLAAARALALKGASVVVLEAGRVIGEASGRNGGQCNTGVAQDYAGLSASLGADKARAYYQAYESAVQSVVSLVEQEQITCDLKRNGKLKLAAKPMHYEGLARTCELIRREVDAEVELLSAEQTRAEVNSAQFHGGLLQRNGVQMHVGRFGVGLAEAAARHGALIHQGTPVTDWKALAGGYRVNTAKGSLHAGQVLLATGACQHGGLGWYRRRIVPVGSFVIATEVLPQWLIDQLLPTGTIRRRYQPRPPLSLIHI